LHGGETLIARVIRLANEAGATPVIAVLGAHHERISAAVPLDKLDKLNNAIPVVNSGWEQGIASSIHAGLRALEDCVPQASGALILGCDQPRLTARHLRALLETFGAQAAPAIVASAYAGIMGIPAVFPRGVFAELRALRGDKGARTLLMQPTCPLIALPFPGGEVDIDLPADLAQLE
jgi:molybdenum cofactor cytidylyltransferase